MPTSTAVSLLTSAARTGSGQGTAVDLGASRSLDLVLDLTAISGTTPSLSVTVQTSINGTSGWRTVAPADGAGGTTVFTAASTVGAQAVTFPDCDQYVRATWALTGTSSPSATFSVDGQAVLVFCGLRKAAQLGARAEGLADVSDAARDAGMRRATDEIASVFDAQEYAGPYTAWGDDTAGACATLGTYYALLARGFRPAESADPIVQALADGRAWLDLVANGKRRPFGLVDSTPTEEEGGDYVTTSTQRGW